MNYQKYPVSVYQWDDKNAPILDGNANCVSTIFKACLVTGYGSKKAVGWTMPFEDQDNGVKVFNPPKSAESDFYLRISEDDGRQLVAQVYFNMTDIETGDLKLQCDTEFKYGTGKFNGKWLLVATARGFWFFTGNKGANNNPENKIGSYFYCGDTARNSFGFRGLYLKYTGGDWGIDDDDRDYIFKHAGSGSIHGKLYQQYAEKTIDISPQSLFNGHSMQTNEVIASPLYLLSDDEFFLLPALIPSTNDRNNFDVISDDSKRMFINHAHNLRYDPSNLYVAIDYWEL